MRNENIPALDARYWAAILAASLVGTTFGDFVSIDLGLELTGALLPLGATILAVIFAAEPATRWAGVACYWAAIVFTRTGTTDLGDFLARSLNLGNGSVSAVLAVLLAVFLVAWRDPASGSATNPGARIARKVLPTTNARYWMGILMVSILGSILGDFVADDLGLGLAQGSLVLGAALTAALVGELTTKRWNEARYWAVIAVARTTGTVVGDFLSGREGLNLGFVAVAGLAGALLVTILLIPSPTPDASKEVASV